MFIKKTVSLLLSLILIAGVLSGCQEATPSVDSNSNSESADSSTATDTSAAEAEFAASDSDMFTDRDYDTSYEEEKSVLIQLNGDSVVCNSDSVVVSGTTVTITGDGTYLLSGTLNDGMIIVNAKETDKPQLVFNGVSIHSESSAPLYILEADKVLITLAEGTDNTLSNGGTFTAIDENNIDSAIFSKQDLILNGSGNLTVSSPAGHGIVSKDDLVLTGGTYTIDSASHGLDANDSVRIANTKVIITSGKDGVHAENTEDEALGFVYIASGTFHISAEGDGISAGATMQIEDGNFDLISGGGSVNATKQSSDSWGGFPEGGNLGGGRPGEERKSEGAPEQGVQELSSASTVTDTEDSSTSMKALKASGNLLINGGTFTMDAADDAVHSNTSITVNNGSFEVLSGDDAFHADEKLTIASGTINITESYEGLEGLHIEIIGGDISLTASDDGLNAAGGTDASGFGGHRGNDQFGGNSSFNGSIVISGGDLYINASGDGIDANGTLTISGGMTTVCGPTQGDTAVLDYDASAVIIGGTFVGTGASQMAQTFSSSEQGVVSASVGNQPAGTTMILKDKSGNTILSYEPELSFAIVIFSSPDIVTGETYTVVVGSSSAEVTAS